MLFYTLYVHGSTYHFTFDHAGVTAARIELTNALYGNQTINVVCGPEWGKLTEDDRAGLAALAADPMRLCREAMTMQREYMQGHSGFLPAHPQLGQMLFGMDLDDWASI